MRVYSLGHPQSIPNLPSYGGCKSWITLQHPVPLGELAPVMPQGKFDDAVAQIKDALGASTIAQPQAVPLS